VIEIAMESPASRKRPNILFIITDQQRFDCLGCMGHPLLETAHIDSIAKEGVLFDNAYSPSPICSPARSAIFSGRFPPASGVVFNWVPFKGDAVLFTELLQEVGYQTANVGKLHFVPRRKRFGFQHNELHDACYNTYADDGEYSAYVKYLQQTRFKDDPQAPIRLSDADEESFDNDLFRFIMGSNWCEEPYHVTAWTAREAKRFLEEREQSKPFFLHVSFFGPHQPYKPPAPWNALYDPADIELPVLFHEEMKNSPIFQHQKAEAAARFRKEFDESTYKELIAAYYGNVAMIDHYVGGILAYLKEHNLWDDTMIVFTTDHGDHLGQYGLFFKGAMYDSCEKVMLLVKPPTYGKRNRKVTEIVNTIDLYGTMLDAAGVQEWKTADIEARSLAPFLSTGGQEMPWDNETYSIIGQHPDTNLTMLRTDDLKLIRLARGEEPALYELYDMHDPMGEVRNVFDDPACRAKRNEMKERLDAWWAVQKQNYPREIKSFMK
jgi:arylsulfatase A-like enzyme